MLCLTGLPLIFHEEIDHWLEDEKTLVALAPGTAHVSKDAVVEKAKSLHPDKVIKFVFWDAEHHPNQMFVSLADSGKAPPENDKRVILDERTATVLEATEAEMGFMEIMFYLHVEMMAGIWGTLFLGLMGLVFVVAMITGVALYGPIMKKLKFGSIRAEKSDRLRWLDLHNVLGIVTLAWAFVVGLTGVINTLAQPALNAWRVGQLAEMVAEYKDKPMLTGTLSSLDDAIEKAKKAAPGMDVSFVAYPGTDFSSNHHYGVFMKGVTPLTSRIIKPALIDAETGAFTDMRDLPWYVNTILISQPFHFGDYGGIPLKIIWAIFDLATIIVLISGLYLWFARRKAKAAQFARLQENDSLTLLALQENGA
jgi:uncharacterized iron-regulated membrane protein